MDQLPCPDGYLLDLASPLAAGHHALNQYLVRVEEAGWQTAIKEMNAVRDKSRKLEAWRALIERMIWLRDNNRGSACLSPLRGLAERIEKWTLAPSEAELIAILDRTAGAADFLAPYTPMLHLLDYVDEHGLSPGLAAAIRGFRDRVWDRGLAVNQVSLQLFRSRLDMLNWRDEWQPIDLKRCWSEQVRADYRSMQGPAREHWRKLLYSIRGDESGRPQAGWLKEAAGMVDTIGAEAYRETVLRWMAPLKRGAVQKLSREGSFLLRSFIWLAEYLKDAAAIAKVDEIREVEFKPKSNGQKVIRAAAEAVGHPEPGNAKPAAPVDFGSILGRTLQAVLAPNNLTMRPDLKGRIEVADGIAYVRGDLDTYQVHLSSGAIYRNSDGRRIHTAASATMPGFDLVPNVAGLAGLLGSILALAEDSTHAKSFRVEGE